jgi:hypothetical protein
MKREKKKEIARWIRVNAEEQGLSCDITGTASQSLSVCFVPPLTAVFANSEAEAREGMKDMMKRVSRGTDFIEGPKGPRQDVLSVRIEEVYKKLKKELNREPTGREVWKALPEDEVIQEIVDDGNDHWLAWRNYRGIEKKTRFKTFLKRLTKIKGKTS